jgi:predicted dehydrogenase
MMSAERKTRISVVGAGYFGSFHAEKLAQMPGAELAAVVDIDGAQAQRLAQKHSVRALTDYRDLVGDVDAVTVAVPTRHHHEITAIFLDHGVHVFVEKPIAGNLDHADDLIQRANDSSLILQCGHIERFSGLFQALRQEVHSPLFIETVRIAPFQSRGTDISVVLDVMIHDIDLTLGIVNEPVQSVDAVGAPVFSDSVDIANTRITFANGCVANLTASRISLKQERRMRIFQPDSYISVDFDQKSLRIVRRSDNTGSSGQLPIDIREISYEEVDSLAAELQSFLTCVSTGGAPLVTGEDGRAALATALIVSESLNSHRRLVEQQGLLHSR